MVALEEKLKEFERGNKTYSLVFLVDDVSYPDKKFDFDGYANWLQRSGYGKAVIYKESQVRETYIMHYPLP